MIDSDILTNLSCYALRSVLKGFRELSGRTIQLLYKMASTTWPYTVTSTWCHRHPSYTAHLHRKLPPTDLLCSTCLKNARTHFEIQL